MSEERTVKACMDGFLLHTLCLSRYFLPAGRNLVVLPIFPLTTLPVLTLIVIYFPSACLHVAFIVLVTASSLSLYRQYVFYFLLLSLPVLATTDCLWPPCTHYAAVLWRASSTYEAFPHFMLMTLHIDFSSLDLCPSSKQPVWDILTILLSTSQMVILPTVLFPNPLITKKVTKKLLFHIHVMGAQFISCSEYRMHFGNFSRCFFIPHSKNTNTPLAQSPSTQIIITLPCDCLHLCYIFLIHSKYNWLPSLLANTFSSLSVSPFLLFIEILKYWKLKHWNWKLKYFSLIFTEVVFISYMNNSVYAPNIVFNSFLLQKPLHRYSQTHRKKTL